MDDGWVGQEGMKVLRDKWRRCFLLSFRCTELAWLGRSAGVFVFSVGGWLWSLLGRWLPYWVSSWPHYVHPLNFRDSALISTGALPCKSLPVHSAVYDGAMSVLDSAFKQPNTLNAVHQYSIAPMCWYLPTKQHGVIAQMTTTRIWCQ
jgi:hypothetical protein